MDSKVNSFSNALAVCPNALKISSNALTDCSYDLTVDS